MSGPVLPPLPEPSAWVSLNVLTQKSRIDPLPVQSLQPGLYKHTQAFAADQMQAYALAAIAGQGDAWQPIETAPMYTPVRLYAQGGGFHDEDFNPSGSVEGFLSDDGNWCGAFWNAEQDDWDRRDGIVPTHWMPLPAPPAITAKDAKL